MDENLRLIAAVLGDVNHGKTTLLDYLAKSKNASLEPGEITQDIRMQYINPNMIMLDTPGHHVFDGARETAIDTADVILLVVAANRGPQSQAAKVIRDCNHRNRELLVVISKIDQATDLEKRKCYEDLEQLGCFSENIGGDVPTVEVSVKASPVVGIDKLKEYLNIFASNKLLKQDKNQPSHGKILDILVGKRGGFDALVKIENGNFKLGKYFFAGNTIGRIRCMWDGFGAIEEALADNIVLINGFEQCPERNARIQIVNTKREAMKLRKEKKRQRNHQITKPKITSDPVVEKKNLVLKAHSELNLGVLGQLLSEHNIRSSSLGPITPAELDILKNQKNSALVCFGRLGGACRNYLQQHNLTYYEDQVIYQLMKKLQDKVEKVKKVEVGKTNILKVFDFSGQKIAGCKVTSGVIKIGAYAELIRSEKTIFVGKITSLKNEKNKITEAQKGSTCGIILNGKTGENSDYLPEDEIITYEEHRETTWVSFFKDPINKNQKFKKQQRSK